MMLMKIYEIRIKPQSFFISPIQGDMLFGCLCWQLHHIGQDLDSLLADYDTNPFMIVSSGIFYQNGRYILPKPLCPDFMLFKNITVENRKQYQKKKFICLYEGETLDINDDLWEKALEKVDFCITQQHNSINRLTGSTGSGESGEFAPFYTSARVYDSEGEIVVFVGVDENRISEEILKTIFSNLGKVGYGKKASSGYGHFTIKNCAESSLWNHDFSSFTHLYALSPFVLAEEEQTRVQENIYFQPITKYGKHGEIYAKGEKPFKKPVIMADMASIVGVDVGWNMKRPFIGRAIRGISYVDERTVVQGYTLCLPCKMEGTNA